MHEPVLFKEVISGLDIKPTDTVLDGTVGFGGHASGVIELLGPSGKYIGLDTDPVAIKHCQEKFGTLNNVHIIHKSYADFPEALSELKIGKVDKVLVDLGFSSYQLDQSGRGFSFLKDEPLDMRMRLNLPTTAEPGQRNELTASFVINNYPQSELKRILIEHGELYKCDKFTEILVQAREKVQINSTSELVEFIKKGFFFGNSRKRFLKTCSLVFQALRIEVNQELANLKIFLQKLPVFLAPGARVAIISFHSLEDRIVKYSFSEHINKTHISKYAPKESSPTYEIKPINKRVIQASQSEIRNNLRAKSAKLRIFEVMNALPNQQTRKNDEKE
ncbi:16S rRNA (cytosine(1402)-N(4))-methyltransferase RsmH [Candidatus Margulisiibacteriota bacterium]